MINVTGAWTQYQRRDVEAWPNYSCENIPNNLLRMKILMFSRTSMYKIRLRCNYSKALDSGYFIGVTGCNWKSDWTIEYYKVQSAINLVDFKHEGETFPISLQLSNSP